MRFQQKLQKEQDQKRNEVSSPGGAGGGFYRTTTTSVTTSSNGGVNGNGVGGGKVRQLFEERRQQRGVGIDKSYPLQPIHPTATSTTTKRSSSLLDNGRPSVVASKPYTSTRTITRPIPGGHSTTTRTVTTSSSSSKYDPNNNFDSTDFGDHPRYGGGLNGKLAGLSISSEINNNAGGAIKLKPVHLPLSSANSTTRTSTINGPGGVVTKRTVTTSSSSSVKGNGDSHSSRSSSGGYAAPPASAPRSPVKSVTAMKSATKTVAPKAATTPVRVSGDFHT